MSSSEASESELPETSVLVEVVETHNNSDSTDNNDASPGATSTLNKHVLSLDLEPPREMPVV
jgi:hypothetical protein